MTALWLQYPLPVQTSLYVQNERSRGGLLDPSFNQQARRPAAEKQVSIQ
jgi:hypothetical protein